MDVHDAYFIYKFHVWYIRRSVRVDPLQCSLILHSCKKNMNETTRIIYFAQRRTQLGATDHNQDRSIYFVESSEAWEPDHTFYIIYIYYICISTMRKICFRSLEQCGLNCWIRLSSVSFQTTIKMHGHLKYVDYYLRGTSS